jgi:hypothetical protein
MIAPKLIAVCAILVSANGTYSLIFSVKIGVLVLGLMVCAFGRGLQRHNGAQLFLH